MSNQATANSERLAVKHYGGTTILLALTAFFVLDFKTKRLKILRWLVLMMLSFGIANVGLYIFAHTNSWLTSYEISNSNGEYFHATDSLSNDIFAYMTGRGPRPEYMQDKREYVRDMLGRAEMEVPADFDFYTNAEIDATVFELYRQRGLDSEESLHAVFYDIITKIENKATEPPIRNISDEDYENLGILWQRTGGVKFRFAADRRNGSYFRSLMSASSPDGDNQNFHSALEGTVYIRYGDSVQGLLNEAAHPIAFHEAPYQYYVGLIYGATHSLFRAVLRIPQTAYELHQEDYQDPATFEGNAHLIAKPALLEELELGHLVTEASTKPSEEHVCVMPDITGY